MAWPERGVGGPRGTSRGLWGLETVTHPSLSGWEGGLKTSRVWGFPGHCFFPLRGQDYCTLVFVPESQKPKETPSERVEERVGQLPGFVRWFSCCCSGFSGFGVFV